MHKMKIVSEFRLKFEQIVFFLFDIIFQVFKIFLMYIMDAFSFAFN